MVWALVSNGVSAHIIWYEMIWKEAWWDIVSRNMLFQSFFSYNQSFFPYWNEVNRGREKRSSGENLSTSVEVLEYCHRSTGVFLGKYSSTPIGVLWCHRFLLPRLPFTARMEGDDFIPCVTKLRKKQLAPFLLTRFLSDRGWHWWKSEGWKWKCKNLHSRACTRA